MGKKRGRPVEQDKRTHRINVRLSDEDVYTLEFIQRKTGKSKSEIIRNCFLNERARLSEELFNRF